MFYSKQGLIQFIDFVEMFDTFDIAGCLLAYFDIEMLTLEGRTYYQF